MTARRSETPDWTTGPAKWVAVAILGVSSIAGMAWSIARAQGPRLPITSPVTPPGVATQPAANPPPIPPPANLGKKINLNTATAAELELLPGIGPAVAQRIVDHRTAHGPFKRIDDLDQVKGIGPRTLDKLRDLVITD